MSLCAEIYDMPVVLAKFENWAGIARTFKSPETGETGSAGERLSVRSGVHCNRESFLVSLTCASPHRH